MKMIAKMADAQIREKYPLAKVVKKQKAQIGPKP
jgi:hypothetical protein